jgi:proteasome accessory factor B
MFKLSRMTALPKRVSRAGSYEVPADLDLRRLAASLAPREPTETAVLAIRTGKAPGLARRGEPATANVELPAGFAVYAVGFSDLHTAAEEITQYAADVVVLEPAELRDLVIRGLTAVAESVAAA